MPEPPTPKSGGAARASERPYTALALALVRAGVPFAEAMGMGLGEAAQWLAEWSAMQGAGGGAREATQADYDAFF